MSFPGRVKVVDCRKKGWLDVIQVESGEVVVQADWTLFGLKWWIVVKVVDTGVSCQQSQLGCGR